MAPSHDDQAVVLGRVVDPSRRGHVGQAAALAAGAVSVVLALPAVAWAPWAMLGEAVVLAELAAPREAAALAVLQPSAHRRSVRLWLLRVRRGKWLR